MTLGSRVKPLGDSRAVGKSEELRSPRVYKRSLALELFQRAREMGEVKDTSPGGVSLSQQVFMTLEVEVERESPRQRFDSRLRCAAKL
jgi:hypothetical protein